MKDKPSNLPPSELLIGENCKYISLLEKNEDLRTQALVDTGHTLTENPRTYKNADTKVQEFIAQSITQVIRSTYTTNKGECLYPLPINDNTGALEEIDTGTLLPRLIWDKDVNPVGLSASIERANGWIELGRTGKTRGSLSGNNLSISPIMTARITDTLENKGGEIDRGMAAFYAEIRVVSDREDGILPGRWIQKRFLSKPEEGEHGYGFGVAGLTYLYCVGGNEPFMHVVKPFSQTDFILINSNTEVVIPPGPHEELIGYLYESMGITTNKIIINNPTSEIENNWITHIPPTQNKIYWQLTPNGHHSIEELDEELLTAVQNGEIKAGTIKDIGQEVLERSPFLLAKIPADYEHLTYTQELLSFGMHVCGIIPKATEDDTVDLLIGAFGDQAKIHGIHSPQLLENLYSPNLLKELDNLNKRLLSKL
jgi:hypothetical protein